MFLSKLKILFLNWIIFYRFSYSLCSLFFVFFTGYVLTDNLATKVFSILAISKATASIISLGFGANILKPMVEKSSKEKDEIIYHIILIKIIYCVVTALIIDKLNITDVNVFIIFCCLIGSVWVFVDIYVEILPKKHYQRYFKTKALFAISSLLIKILLIYLNVELLFYILTLEGYFCLLFLIIHHKVSFKYKNLLKLNTFIGVKKLILHGKFIWLSSILQIGGTRVLYLIINSHASANVSIIYYLLMRLVEGLNVIPNNITASIYKKIILSKNKIQQTNFRSQMLKQCIIAGAFATPILLVTIHLFIYYKNIEIKNISTVYLTGSIILILSFLRVWMSREIIFNENLIASPISYFSSVLLTVIGVVMLSENDSSIIFCLVIYYITACITPFFINKLKMKSSLNILKTSLCTKEK